MNEAARIAPRMSARAERRPRNVVAFDGDDTLWSCGRKLSAWERSFQNTAYSQLPKAAAKYLRGCLAENGFTADGLARSLMQLDEFQGRPIAEGRWHQASDLSSIAP